MNIKCQGLKPILDKVFPLLQQILEGEWITIHPGVELQVPPDANIELVLDGKYVLINGLGIPLRVDPSELSVFIPCRSKNVGSADSAVVDQAGIDIKTTGFIIPGVRLVAAD